MNILFKRQQRSASIFQLVPLKIGSGVTFSLHAELELDPEEMALLTRYRLANAPIVISDLLADIRRAIPPAFLLAFVVFVIAFFFLSFRLSFTFFVVTLIAMTIVYYRELRESISVDNLLNGGRTWRCDSIVELVQKEAFLQNVSAYLRQVLESAKTWDDREVIPILPLSKEDARKALLKVRNG